MWRTIDHVPLIMYIHSWLLEARICDHIFPRRKQATYVQSKSTAPLHADKASLTRRHTCIAQQIFKRSSTPPSALQIYDRWWRDGYRAEAMRSKSPHGDPPGVQTLVAVDLVGVGTRSSSFPRITGPVTLLFSMLPPSYECHRLHMHPT